MTLCIAVINGGGLGVASRLSKLYPEIAPTPCIDLYSTRRTLKTFILTSPAIASFTLYLKHAAQ